LGECFFAKGDHTVSLKVLSGALRLSEEGAAELIGIHYKLGRGYEELGRSYEELGRAEEARDAYERVVAIDLEFRDAAVRLARL
jgi:tetratricopeptide (TPR) repeat protein